MALPRSFPPGPDALFELVWERILGRVVLFVVRVLDAADVREYGEDIVQEIGRAVRSWIHKHYDSLKHLPLDQVVDQVERIVFHNKHGIAIRVVWRFRDRAARHREQTFLLAQRPVRSQTNLALRVLLAKEVLVRWRVFDIRCFILVLRYYLVGIERLDPEAYHEDFVPTAIRIHRCKERFLKHLGGSPI